MEKREKKAKQKHKKSNILELDDIIQLGGDKKDLEIIQDVDGNEETIDFKEVAEDDEVTKDEIQEFIEGLKFWKVMGQKDGDGHKSSKTPDKTSENSKDVKQSKARTLKKKNKNKFKIQDDEISSTTDSAAVETEDSSDPSMNVAFIDKYNRRKYALVKLTGKWYEQFDSDPVDFVPVKRKVVEKLRTYAQTMMQDELAEYKKQQEKKKSSDAKWIKTVLTSGTLGDKTAAYTLLIQESPVHNLSCLDTLVGMVTVKGRREALMVIEPLKELFMELLPDRKLVTFDKHPYAKVEELSSGNNDTRDRRILLWYFEEQLKERYKSFVKAAEKFLHDQLSAPKIKVLGIVYEMLASKPEEEKTLLNMLVNKLGDPDSKIASHCILVLKKLVDKHPNMKMVVVLEVERMLYRVNISERAQYYAVCFLNQLILSRSDQELASKLVAIYFSFFKVFTKKKKNETKMLAGLLTGVNRAFPYAKIDSAILEEEVNTLYRTVHTVNFTTAVQALMLLYHTMQASSSVSDRYYSALYRKLLDPCLATSSKQTMFLNLLYKSLKKDDCDARVKAFIKRLLQTCSQLSTNFICGALMLLSEILQEKPNVFDIRKLVQEVDSESDDEMEHFDDVRSESDDEERKSSKSKETSKAEVDHEVELKKVLRDKGKTTVKASWVHIKDKQGKGGGTYDMVARNPMYCRADTECVWELKKLEQHFHPTVRMFAGSLLKGQRISYEGDPLPDFTLIKFLDRFIYKNPKKTDKDKSIMSRKAHAVKGTQKVPVNSEKYLEQKEKDVPVDEKFYYRYFQEEAKRKGHKKLSDFDEGASDVSDSEFDDFLSKYERQLDGKDANFDFDFASEFDKQKKKKKNKKDEDDEDSDFDLDEFENLSDEELDFGDDEDFNKAFESGEELKDFAPDEAEPEDDDDGGWESDEEEMDDDTEVGQEIRAADDSFDEDEIAFSDDEEGGGFTLGDLANPPKSQGVKGAKKRQKTSDKTTTLKNKRKRSEDKTELLAAGEELSSLMEENAGDQFGVGTGALSNKDKAHAKQLSWEVDQERWMKNKDWKSRKRVKSKSFKGHNKGAFRGKGGKQPSGKFKRR